MVKPQNIYSTPVFKAEKKFCSEYLKKNKPHGTLFPIVSIKIHLYFIFYTYSGNFTQTNIMRIQMHLPLTQIIPTVNSLDVIACSILVSGYSSSVYTYRLVSNLLLQHIVPVFNLNYTVSKFVHGDNKIRWIISISLQE